MKLAIRVGLAVLGLLLIGGGGFAGWRYFRPQQGGAPVIAKPRGDVKPQAAATPSKPPSTPETSMAPPTPTAPPAAAAPAVEKTAASAQEKAPAVAPQTTTTPPAPGAPVVEKQPASAQEKAPGAPASRDAEQERLIRVYGGMKPKEAAAVMGQLDPALSVTILSGLQERQASKILGQLPPKTAADLITRLSQMKRPPDTDASAQRPHAGGKS